ncbi:MAG: dephospho-CoA kinase [Armatimonadetes bacterium]|nr:dephospho-CoA kinase [Armatimonadota bacterium]
MKTLGVTGGIACGKSFVTAQLSQWGAQTASADADAREVVLPGTPTLETVFAAFPESRLPGGMLNRRYLAERTFGDPDVRAKLESLLHPAIFARMEATISTARTSDDAPLLAYEVPLLFEKNRESLFDETLAVVCSPEMQAERLQARELAKNGGTLTSEQIAERLAAQLSNEEKASRADFVIYTDGTEADTTEQARAVWRELTGSEPPASRV